MMLVVRGCGVGRRSSTGSGGLNFGHAGGCEVVDEAGCEEAWADFGGALEAFGFGIFGCKQYWIRRSV